MKHLHPTSVTINVNKCKDFRKNHAYDSYPSVLTDKRRMSVKRIKIFEFLDHGMVVESNDLIRQVINYNTFDSKSMNLLFNLYKYYQSLCINNYSSISNYVATKVKGVTQEIDLIYELKDPILAAVIGYHGVFKIEFEDKNLYTYAAIAAVCES